MAHMAPLPMVQGPLPAVEAIEATWRTLVLPAVATLHPATRGSRPFAASRRRFHCPCCLRTTMKRRTACASSFSSFCPCPVARSVLAVAVYGHPSARCSPTSWQVPGHSHQTSCFQSPLRTTAGQLNQSGGHGIHATRAGGSWSGNDCACASSFGQHSGLLNSRPSARATPPAPHCTYPKQHGA